MKPPAPWRIRQLVEGQVVVGWVVEQLVCSTFPPPGVHLSDWHSEAEYVVVDYFPSGPAAIEAFATYGEMAV